MDRALTFYELAGLQLDQGTLRIFIEYNFLYRECWREALQSTSNALNYYNFNINIEATFKHVVKTVAGVELTDHVVDVIFTLFDEDGNDLLEIIGMSANTLKEFQSFTRF